MPCSAPSGGPASVESCERHASPPPTPRCTPAALRHRTPAAGRPLVPDSAESALCGTLALPRRQRWHVQAGVHTRRSGAGSAAGSLIVTTAACPVLVTPGSNGRKPRPREQSANRLRRRTSSYTDGHVNSCRKRYTYRHTDELVALGTTCRAAGRQGVCKRDRAGPARAACRAHHDAQLRANRCYPAHARPQLIQDAPVRAPPEGAALQTRRQRRSARRHLCGRAAHGRSSFRGCCAKVYRGIGEYYLLCLRAPGSRCSARAAGRPRTTRRSLDRHHVICVESEPACEKHPGIRLGIRNDFRRHTGPRGGAQQPRARLHRSAGAGGQRF